MVSAAALQSPDCEIIANDCTWYERCAERTTFCGRGGYALGYAQHYCQKFKSASGNLSPQGQAWIPNVMRCLQSALLPFVLQEKPLTCPQIRAVGFRQHVDCYVDNGFCDLPKSDWLAIGLVASKQIFDIDTHITAGQILRKCNPPLGPNH
jgi:hypothetical protein